MSGINNYHLSADGKKLIYRSGSSYGVVDIQTVASVGDGSVDLSEARIEVTRAEEFLQIFDEAWRIQRDWFYDPDLHGVDWDKIGHKYRRFVASCGVRADLNYLIGEMIGELNAGHTYIYGGDYEDGADPVNTGLLGVDFAAEAGAGFFRVAHIVPGNPWKPGEISPLAMPGCPIEEGDYLIAIDGQQITTADNVYRALFDKSGKMVTLTYNDRPSASDAKTHRVETLGSEYGIRHREWVENNRAAVAEASDGRLGYFHMTDMSRGGLIDFASYYYPQTLKEGLVIDVRYNGGGFTGDMVIDRLERELWAITTPREGGTLRDPERDFHGPFVVLINQDSYSNAEYFSQAIKEKGLAPLIGTRTWGGAVGIEPHQDMVDGSGTTPPQFGIYGLARGDWLIEGRGVEPDIEVENTPASVVAGEDLQLEAGIEQLLRTLREEGDRWAIPPVPAYPRKNKSGE
ncbi:MAG: S41 family peptidase [bacterium]